MVTLVRWSPTHNRSTTHPPIFWSTRTAFVGFNHCKWGRIRGCWAPKKGEQLKSSFFASIISFASNASAAERQCNQTRSFVSHVHKPGPRTDKCFKADKARPHITKTWSKWSWALRPQPKQFWNIALLFHVLLLSWYLSCPVSSTMSRSSRLQKSEVFKDLSAWK